MSADFYGKASELTREGVPFATAFVVRAESPTSAKPGDKAIITADGTLYGWIGGSCAQPSVTKAAFECLQTGEPRLVRLTPDPQAQPPREGVQDLAMTCFSGGTLEVFIEPQLPAPRLLIIGSLPIAQALLRLGRFMNYQVIAVDPDKSGIVLPEGAEVMTELAQIPAKITPLTYVVVASHGNYDEAALVYALRSKAAYIALVTSKKRANAVLEYLAAQGLTPDETARLKYPAGLDIKASQSEEIALSIMAEIVQHRRTPKTIALEAFLPAKPREAIDPVCGMTVQIDEVKFTFEYGGETYYFCCPACRKLFAATPEQYLKQPAPSGEAIDPICGMTVDIATAKYMSEYAGKIYYFCAPGCKMSFDKSPSSYIKLVGA